MSSISHATGHVQRSTICDTTGAVWSSARICVGSAELAKVVARHGLQMHQYADDIQTYTYMMIDDAAAAVDHFDACLTDVEAWLRASYNGLN